MNFFTLERVTQPEVEPVTLAEIIYHVREYAIANLAQAAQDQLTALIKAGREWAEDYTGRALIDQTWRLTLSDYVAPFANVDSDTVIGVYRGTLTPTAHGILLRKSPVLAITSFVTVDAAGVETTVDPTTYELREADSKWPRLFLSGAPSGGTIRIVFRAGFADMTGSPQDDASVVPERFKQAIKLWVEGHYNRDEKLMPLLLEVAEKLLMPECAELRTA